MIHATFAGQGLSLEGHALPTPRPHATITPDQEAYGRSIVDTCRNFAGTPFEPDILKRLRSVASKHAVEITNEALLDILAEALHVKPISAEQVTIAGGAAIDGAQPESVPSAFRSEALASLEQESFQGKLRTATEADTARTPEHRSAREQETSGTPTHQRLLYSGPTEWEVSYVDGKPNYTEGRFLLQDYFMRLMNHHRKEGIPLTCVSKQILRALFEPHFEPTLLHFDAQRGTLRVSGEIPSYVKRMFRNCRDIWSTFWNPPRT